MFLCQFQYFCKISAFLATLFALSSATLYDSLNIFPPNTPAPVDAKDLLDEVYYCPSDCKAFLIPTAVSGQRFEEYGCRASKADEIMKDPLGALQWWKCDYLGMPLHLFVKMDSYDPLEDLDPPYLKYNLRYIQLASPLTDDNGVDKLRCPYDSEGRKMRRNSSAVIWQWFQNDQFIPISAPLDNWQSFWKKPWQNGTSLLIPTGPERPDQILTAYRCVSQQDNRPLVEAYYTNGTESFFKRCSFYGEEGYLEKYFPENKRIVVGEGEVTQVMIECQFKYIKYLKVFPGWITPSVKVSFKEGGIFWDRPRIDVELMADFYPTAYYLLTMDATDVNFNIPFQKGSVSASVTLVANFRHYEDWQQSMSIFKFDVEFKFPSPE